jgi:hypothetical protein
MRANTLFEGISPLRVGPAIAKSVNLDAIPIPFSGVLPHTASLRAQLRMQRTNACVRIEGATVSCGTILTLMLLVAPRIFVCRSFW